MSKVRQDSWSHEDDLLLAETVLRHVREGSTQLNAFEEVGDELNRTSAACGFRWNAEVRQNYIQAMELAKRQRKDKKRALHAAEKQHIQTQQHVTKTPLYPSNETQQVHNPTQTGTLEQVIYQLQQLHHQDIQATQSTYEMQEIKRENKLLKEQVQSLESQIKQTDQQFLTMKEDYEAFVQIMERARKLTVFDDQEPRQSPAFKMDKNGNLEQLVERLN